MLRITQRHFLEQWLENVYQTHQEQASGKSGLQKSSLLQRWNILVDMDLLKVLLGVISNSHMT